MLLLKAGFKAMEPRGQLALILYTQTFGDLVTFNPYIHSLVTDGVFLPSGTFRVLPPLPEKTLCEALRQKMLSVVCTEGVLAAELGDRMLQWRHSGFYVHNRIRSKAADTDIARVAILRDGVGSTSAARTGLRANLHRNLRIGTLHWY